jgi:hypothetical protein
MLQDAKCEWKRTAMLQDAKCEWKRTAMLQDAKCEISGSGVLKVHFQMYFSLCVGYT